MKNLSFQAFNQWVEKQSQLLSENAFFDAASAFEVEGVQFHEGNLEVAHLDISPCVVIDGDLVVERISYQFDCGLLVVNGSLKCRDLNFPFDTVIAGDIYAEQVDINSGCDYSLTVGGSIFAHSVIERGHSIVVSGDINAPIIKSMMNVISSRGKTFDRSAYEDKN